MANDPPPDPINRRDVLAGLAASLALSTEAVGQTGAATCVLTPQTDEGPYYFDPKLVRSDITERQPGKPLLLDIRVVTAGDCAPVKGVRVDVWHSNARGVYSGYADQRGTGTTPDRSAAGQTFLRGTQFADSEGRTSFRTIYPSWYYGRTPHIHFKVFLEPREVVVSQLYFPDAVSDKIFAGSRDYVARSRTRDTYNENDMFLRNGTRGAFCDVKEEGASYRASVVVGIERT